MSHPTDDMRRMIRTLMSFYWAEVARTQSSKNYDEARNYQGIVEFCTALEAFAEEADIINNQQ